MKPKFDLAEFEALNIPVAEEPKIEVEVKPDPEPEVEEKSSSKFVFSKPKKNNLVARKNFAVTEEHAKKFKKLADKYGMSENQLFNELLKQLFEE